MITAILCQDNKAIRGGLELIEQWELNKQSWLWLDLENEDTDVEMSLLKGRFAFDELLVKEAQRVRHPPSIEFFPTYFYLLNKPLTSDSEDLDFSTHQVAIFCNTRLLVTRHVNPSSTVRMWQKKLMENCAKLSPIDLVAAINKRLTQRYGRILLDLEHRLDEIEDQLFERRNNHLLQELVGYSTALRKMHRILTYHADAFEQLAEYQHEVHKDVKYNQFDGIHALMRRYLSLSELYLNVINDLADAYISLDSHHLNQIMKVLTIVTVVFLPLSLLVGVYGMNFEFIPELKLKYGYFILLGVMTSIAGGLLYLFRKVRWL